MFEMTDLLERYRALRRRHGLRPQPPVHSDGEGLAGLWNPALRVWQWWRWEPRRGYMLVGSTLRRSAK